MAPDIEEIIREALTSALQGENGNSSSASEKSSSNGSHSGVKGLAAGAGVAALAPLVLKSAGKLARGLGVDSLEDLVKSPGEALEGAKSNLGDRLTSSVKDTAKEIANSAAKPVVDEYNAWKDTVKK